MLPKAPIPTHVSAYPALTLVHSPQYNNGIPPGSRFENHADFFKKTINSLNEEEGLKKIEKVKSLSAFAEKGACALRPPSTFPAATNCLPIQIHPSLY